MFLWVRLVLDSLDAVYSPEQLRSIVNDLPSDIEALYERIYLRICNIRGPQAYGGVPRMLGWICHARRPLHIDELLHGIAVSPTEAGVPVRSVPIAAILDHCKPFVEQRPDSTLALIHFSVNEYVSMCL
jgi:hypothetical protein